MIETIPRHLLVIWAAWTEISKNDCTHDALITVFPIVGGGGGMAPPHPKIFFEAPPMGCPHLKLKKEAPPPIWETPSPPATETQNTLPWNVPRKSTINNLKSS